MSFEPSLVRRALDYLLDVHPMLDIVSIDWQTGDPLARLGSSVNEHTGPWVLVQLGQPSETFDETPAWALWNYAIWKRTGAVHTFGDESDAYPGAVSDDPIWTPPEIALPCDRHPGREAVAKIGLPGPGSRWACAECFAESQ